MSKLKNSDRFVIKALIVLHWRGVDILPRPPLLPFKGYQSWTRITNTCQLYTFYVQRILWMDGYMYIFVYIHLSMYIDI